MSKLDANYLYLRMVASYRAADRARHPAARGVHLKLAAAYHERWQSECTGDLLDKAAIPRQEFSPDRTSIDLAARKRYQAYDLRISKRSWPSRKHASNGAVTASCSETRPLLKDEVD